MNRIYIYQDVNGVTDEYHPCGGLAIITDSGDPEKVFRNHFPDLEPDFFGALPFSYEIDENAQEQVYVFPNTGCC